MFWRTAGQQTVAKWGRKMSDTAEWLMLMLLNLKVTRTETLVWGMLGGEGVPVASNQDISSA